MQVTNPDRDLVVNYDIHGESVIRTFTSMDGTKNKKVFTKPKAHDDVKDLMANYDYRRIS